MKQIRALGETAKGTRDTEILRRAIAILEAMGNNTDIFNEPVPSLELLHDAKEDYQTKLAICSKTRGLQDISLKNEAKEVLAEILQRLAFYVNVVTDGHLPSLYASGFRITALPIKGRIAATPQWVRCRDGHLSGMVLIEFERVAGCRVSYEYACALSDDLESEPKWEMSTHTTTSRRNPIAGLIPRSVLNVRVRSINPNGYSEWSETIQHIVR